tara:strand:+ start:6 stop:344 length:339 start_codon:yes stop_codon:yes gene_type:complete
MDEPYLKKLIKKLRIEFEARTSENLTSYADPNFVIWLQNNNPIERPKEYVSVERQKFSKALMESYLTSINQISSLLGETDTDRTFTKEEVLDIVNKAFSIAKTEGETTIKKL